jgi:transcriptional regulator with XRE-family HTH domain
MAAEITESRIRKIRKTAGLSLTAAAALAKRSPTTWRIYEIGGRAAVSADAAEDCDRAVREMLELIERERAA